MADERQKPPSSAHHDADSISASSATTSVSRGIAPRRARARRIAALNEWLPSRLRTSASSAWTIKSSASALRSISVVEGSRRKSMYGISSENIDTMSIVKVPRAR